MELTGRSLDGLRAPEFPAGLVWLNSDPLTIKSLQDNKVLLLYFWNYSCSDCLQILAMLKIWHERYSSLGLRIIGLHSPEFEFEKEKENVESAIEDLGIVWPQVLDENYKLSQLYHNTSKPRILVVDSRGIINLDHAGEGGYEEIELAIQKQLRTVSVQEISFPKPAKDENFGKVCYETTPKYYLGSSGGSIGSEFSEGFYSDPGKHKQDSVYLQGYWKQEPEFIEHTKVTGEGDDYILLKFRASEVNLVMGSKGNMEIEVEVFLDDRVLDVSILGRDVIFNEARRSIVKVKNFKMYNLIDSLQYLDAKLKIRINSDKLRAYVFSFGGCVSET